MTTEATFAIVSTVLIVLLSIAPIPAIASTMYLWGLYRSDAARPRSWLLRMLAVSGTIVSAAVSYISILALWRLLGFGILPDLLVIGLSVSLLFLSAVPVYIAFRIYRASHRGNRPTLPGRAADDSRDVERDAARDPARDEARDLDRDLGRDEGRDVVRDPARDTARDQEKEGKRGGY